MILIDVNVLVYAHRRDAPNHEDYKAWLTETIGDQQAYGLSDLVLSGVLRVATHPKIFSPPSSLGEVTRFIEAVRARANCTIINPGQRHWEIFMDLCYRAGARGNLVPDAYHAALAIESGSEWITTDGDYGRFAGLKWRHPLAGFAPWRR